jgi:small subunit ribosomal protein S18
MEKTSTNKNNYYFFPKKYCSFCKEEISNIDYKDYEALRRCLLDNGRIKPARATGTCKIHQKQLTYAIKRARHMGLLKFVEDKKGE